MYPLILSIGSFSLHTYGVLVATAFVVGLYVARLGARRRKISETFLMDWAMAVLLSGILGARLFYVLINFDYFRQHPADVFKVWQGGLVFYGGFLVAASVGVWLARRRLQPLASLADISTPALAIGQSIGRLGCFFAGCCYGKPTSSWVGIQFRDPSALAPLGIALHPTQIYESLGTLAIGLVLGWRLLNKKDPAGMLFWLYVLLYGMLRFVLEIFRGDVRGEVMAGMYPSQWIALVAVVLSMSVLVSQAAAPEPMAKGRS